MSLDARVKYTKMMIQKSFIQLLNEKPLSKIKLKEVCEIAGINRSTYYKYYKDTYDWYEQTEKECLNWANIYMERALDVEPRLLILEILQAIKKNSALFSAMFTAQNNLLFVNKILKLSIDKMQEKLIKEQKLELQWDCTFLIHGLNGVIAKWIQDDMQTPVEVIADYLIEKINSIL